MNESSFKLGRYIDFRIVLLVFLFLMILVGVVTLIQIIPSLYTYGRYLITAGLAVVILGFVGMSVSGTGRYSDMSPIYRDVKVYRGFIKRAIAFFKPFASLIIGGVLTALMGYLITRMAV